MAEVRRRGGDVVSELAEVQWSEPLKGHEGITTYTSQRAIMAAVVVVLSLLCFLQRRSLLAEQENCDERMHVLHETMRGLEKGQLDTIQRLQLQTSMKVTPPINCPQCKECDEDSGAAERISNHDEIYLKRNKLLQESHQSLSLELLLHKFGNGPHFVNLHLQFPEPEGGSGLLRLEMAPVEVMPTTVLYFLTQVSEGAWDGCSFFRNANHVLQASTRGKECQPKRFKSLAGIEKSIGTNPTTDIHRTIFLKIVMHFYLIYCSFSRVQCRFSTQEIYSGIGWEVVCLEDRLVTLPSVS